MSKGTCFVIMGFGQKTDYSTGRLIDLNKSYSAIIKPAVESAGLTCLRADEIRHSGTIDVPMYRQILDADLVVADLSTYNPNAFYELGVRHALRPYSTIVIAESEFRYPFDVNHTAIFGYRHLGTVIDYDEAVQAQARLRELIQAVLGKRERDSPVYTYLHDLRPPSRVVTRSGDDTAWSYSVRGEAGPSMSSLREAGEEAFRASDFLKARESFAELREMDRHNPYVLQRLALATYKSKEPTVLESLESAREILRDLHPDQSADPETLGLWGAVHKRLWEQSGNREHLDTSIFSYEKGFYIKNDYYNGINLAYLLDLRASVSPVAEGIADAVSAERVRRRVVALAEALLSSSREEREDRYWILATLAEAWLGLGDTAKQEEWLARAAELNPPAWQRECTQSQLVSLKQLLEKSPKRQVPAT